MEEDQEDGEEGPVSGSYLQEVDSGGSGRGTPDSVQQGDERQEVEEDGRRTNSLNNERTQKSGEF